MEKGKVVVIAKCEVHGKLYLGKRIIEMYPGNSQMVIDANRELVRRTQSSLHTNLWKKYNTIFEEQEKVRKEKDAKIYKALRRSTKSYYKVERWAYGECRGVVKTFPKTQLKVLQEWYKKVIVNNTWGDCVLVPFLTDDKKSIEIDYGCDMIMVNLTK